jgi:DNA relaxase NicK
MIHNVNPSGAPVVIEAGIDWLTIGVTGARKVASLEVWTSLLQMHEAAAGYKRLPFSLMGYSGSSVGRVRYGKRDDLAIAQFSGELADDVAVRALSLADRVSRVDIAVTVRLPQPDPFLGETVYAQASNHRAEHPRSARPMLVQDDDGGCTAYLGKRTSDAYCRVYNKEAEEAASRVAPGDTRYRNCWRAEIEYKGRAAAAVANAAVASPARPDFCQRIVHEYLRTHGISPWFPVDGDRVLISGSRRRSDHQTRMAWFRSAVAPAILKSLEVADRADILEALGLGETPPAESPMGTLPSV